MGVMQFCEIDLNLKSIFWENLFLFHQVIVGVALPAFFPCDSQLISFHILF